MNSKTSVVIIGAGPTGLSMAAQLMRYDIDFIIIEKNAETTPLSKAVVVQARTLEVFQQMDLAKKALGEGRITTALNMLYKGRKKVSIDLAGLGEGLTPYPFALSLEQSKTEKLLAGHLSAHGKTIRWQCEFLRLEQDDHGVIVYYKDADGLEHSIDAQYMVGCDGAHSPVRHAMSTPFEGDTVAKIFYITDVTLESLVINKDELYIFLIKKGFVLFFPMEGKAHYRIVGILPGEHREDQTYQFKDIEGFIKEQITSPVEFKEVRWFSTYKVHSRMAGTFRKDRCFIAGDAAHIHTPAGGQGMNTGIQDAYNLAWKLGYVIGNKLSPAVLESYNTERMENAKHLLRTTDRMFDVMSGTNPFFNFMRLRIMPVIAGFITKRASVRKRIFLLISQTGIAYPHSSLTCRA